MSRLICHQFAIESHVLVASTAAAVDAPISASTAAAVDAPISVFTAAAVEAPKSASTTAAAVDAAAVARRLKGESAWATPL